jgi:hypothetical protein
MSEAYDQQIEDLLRSGKITPEEAAQLRGEPEGEPAVSPSVEPADAPARLAVRLFGGDVRVRAVPGLERPALTGNRETIDVIPTRDGWRVVPKGMSAGHGLLGLLVRGLRGLAHQRVEIEVPPGLERLEVDVVTGDVEVDGVAGAVVVRAQQGAVTLVRTGPFDISTKVGDVRVRAKLDGGESRIAVLSGRVDVTLLEGSSVALRAALVNGRAHARHLDLAPEDGLVGARYRARVGEGAALLNVSLTSGDLDVVAEGGR